MPRRYPLATVQKIRADQVDAEGRAVAERVRERERAESSLSGQRARRVDEQVQQSRVAAEESVRLTNGGATVADLAALGEWRVGADERAAAHGAGVERAERQVEIEVAAEAEARRELAQADARAEAVERHREKWRADAERQAAQTEEDESLDIAANRRAR